MSDETRKIEDFIQLEITRSVEQKNSQKVQDLMRLLFYMHKEVDEASKTGSE